MARLCLIVCVVAVSACASSGETTDRATATARDHDTVYAEDLEGRDLRRVEDMLRGQVSGVRVVHTTAGLAIRIRGASTSSPGAAGTSPLFIIDGLPLDVGADGVLDGINPRDIASIRVLKNASDTAMYGARGANGVILITTHRPPPPSDG